MNDQLPPCDHDDCPKAGPCRQRQYFFRVPECRAATAHAPDCICWHDEGTGPLADNPYGPPQGWRCKPNPKDWPEDFSHENGNYQCRCFKCDSVFTGHKRRNVCKECATKPPNPFHPFEPLFRWDDELSEISDANGHAFAVLFDTASGQTLAEMMNRECESQKDTNEQI